MGLHFTWMLCVWGVTGGSCSQIPLYKQVQGTMQCHNDSVLLGGLF